MVLFSTASTIGAYGDGDKEIYMPGGPWNSLEIVKLVVGIVTAGALLYLGNQNNSALSRASMDFQADQMRKQRRATDWDRISAPLQSLMTDLKVASKHTDPLTRDEVSDLVWKADKIREDWENISIDFTPATNTCADRLAWAIRKRLAILASSSRPETLVADTNPFELDSSFNDLKNQLQLDFGYISKDESSASTCLPESIGPRKTAARIKKQEDEENEKILDILEPYLKERPDRADRFPI